MLAGRNGELHPHANLQAAAQSVGLAERPVFQELNPDDQKSKLARHPVNQDTYFAHPALGLVVADGLTSRALSGKGGQAAVVAFTEYLADHGAPNEAAQNVAEMIPYAAEAATLAMRETCGLDSTGAINGSTTFTGFFRTANPGVWVRYHVGDSRGLHIRDGAVLSQTVDQVLYINPDTRREVTAGGVQTVSNYLGADLFERRKPSMLPKKYAHAADKFLDTIDYIEAEPGDWLVLHTDGLALRSEDGPREINPVSVAKIVSQHQRPEGAVQDLMLLPDVMATALNEREHTPGKYYPKIDDLTVVVGRFAIGRR